MESKKGLVIGLILFVFVAFGSYFVIKSAKKDDSKMLQESEYTPQEEISSSQARQTIVSLYFQNKETSELVPEARLIDIKDLMGAPIEKLVSLLIDGPKNGALDRLIPDNVKLEKYYMEGDVAVLEFSSSIFSDDMDENTKANLLDSIKRTLTQLTEVNDVKFNNI